MLFPTDEVTTEAAKQVWEYAYPGEPWPEGLTVGWNDLTAEKADAVTVFERWSDEGVVVKENPCRIELSWWLKDRDEADVIFSLIHEFTHVRKPRLKHGEGFQRETIIVYGRIRGDWWTQDIARSRTDLAATKWELRAVQRQGKRLREQLARLNALIADTK